MQASFMRPIYLIVFCAIMAHPDQLVIVKLGHKERT